ncbi:MAG: PKD domain-containing protein, partial [Methanobacteriota archaeon]
APAVAGVVALMVQADPSLLPADVKRILRETAEDVGPAGFDPGTGEGSVDAFAAVARVLAEKDGGGPVNGTNRPPAAEAGGPYRGEAGRLVTLRGIATDPDGRIVEYSWDFEDDGTVDVRSKVNGTAGHVYDAPGNFTARFRAGDDAGATAEDVARVEIRPRADFGRPTPDPEENVTEPEGPDRGGKSRVGGGIPAISAGAFVGGAALLALLLRERRR